MMKKLLLAAALLSASAVIADGNDLTAEQELTLWLETSGVSYIWRDPKIFVFNDTKPADVCQMAVSVGYLELMMVINRSTDEAVFCTPVKSKKEVEA